MLRDIQDELAGVLETVIGSVLTADGIDGQFVPRLALDISESPCFDVYDASPSRDSESAGFGDVSGAYVLTVRVRVATADDESMQSLLVDMIDDDHDLCVAKALVSDPTLGGWATDVWVDPEGFSGLLDLSTTAKQMVGRTWRVLVEAAES